MKLVTPFILALGLVSNTSVIYANNAGIDLKGGINIPTDINLNVAIKKGVGLKTNLNLKDVIQKNGVGTNGCVTNGSKATPVTNGGPCKAPEDIKVNTGKICENSKNHKDCP